MANKKTVYIKPIIQAADIAAMAKSMTKGVKEVAATYSNVFTRAGKFFGKSFGKTATAAVKGVGRMAWGGIKMMAGGSLFGLGMSLLEKMKDQYGLGNEEINKALQTADAVVTQAQAFGTTPDEMYRMLQIGKTVGLNNEAILKMITKVQDLQGQEKKEKGSTVLAGAQGLSDKPFEAFLQIISGLQQMKDKNEAAARFSEVFDVRLLGKNLELLQTSIPELSKRIGKLPKDFNELAYKEAGLEEKQAIGRVQNEQDLFIKEMRMIDSGKIKTQKEAEAQEDKKKLLALENFETAAWYKNKTEEASQLAAMGMISAARAMERAVELASKFSKDTTGATLQLVEYLKENSASTKLAYKETLEVFQKTLDSVGHGIVGELMKRRQTNVKMGQ